MQSGFHKLPEGAKCSDALWQNGYNDGFDEIAPEIDDPVYVSGWCTGYCGNLQCNYNEAEAAYLKAIESKRGKAHEN